MLFVAAYAPPFRASIVPPVLNRRMTAKSVYAAAAPCDSPVAASSPVPLGVASNVAVKDPFCEVNALFWNAVVLAAQPGAAPVTVTAEVPLCPSLVAVIAAVPLCPSLVAVIVAEPATTPLTSPLELTVATEVLLLDQLIVRPVSGLPLTSFGVAVSCSVWPAGTLAGAGLTVTDATGTLVTVIADVPLFPSLAAVIVADPAALLVTNPPVFTLATEVLLLA